MALPDNVVVELRLKPEMSFRNKRWNSNQISGTISNISLSYCNNW